MTMTAPKVVAARHHQALTELAEILERHDPEATTRLAKTNHGGGIPSPTKRPLENSAFLAECMLSLARIVDEQLAPKKRGRPRKTT
jgi:hypothetical protein